MGKEIDPSDVGKYPELIKKAQAEMTTLDVLVCGQCHSSFHFIEQFNEHKSPSCTKSSKIKDSTEQRPVVWAFLLWKAAQLNQEPNKDSPPQWCIYQQWIKLDDAIKETWIVAGRTIQSFSRIGLGQLQEMPVKITKTVVDNATNSGQKPRPPPQQVTRPGQRDLDSAFNALKQAETKKIINRSPQHKLPINAVARPVAKPGGISRIALRTLATSDEGTETEEHTIEKILAKRFNPRLKEHEYLIKWQGMSHETNTWEPLSHLSSCPVLLDTFEKQLAKQKEQRALQEARKTQSAGVVIKEEPEVATKKRKIDATEASKLVNQAKSNGITFSNAIKQETSAEVVITSAKDGKPTGIVKKTGITVNPITKNEAQVKVIPKGGDSVSGVVRVTPNKPVQQHGNTTVKPVQNVSRASVAAPKPAIQRSTQQTVSYQSTTVAPAPKPTISRVVKNAPTPKQITPEQKIAALTRQGDLKITRKPVAQQPALPQATVVVADEEDFTVREDFELNIPAAVPNELVQGADSELALLQHGKIFHSQFRLVSTPANETASKQRGNKRRLHFIKMERTVDVAAIIQHPLYLILIAFNMFWRCLQSYFYFVCTVCSRFHF